MAQLRPVRDSEDIGVMHNAVDNNKNTVIIPSRYILLGNDIRSVGLSDKIRYINGGSYLTPVFFFRKYCTGTRIGSKLNKQIIKGKRLGRNELAGDHERRYLESWSVSDVKEFKRDFYGTSNCNGYGFSFRSKQHPSAFIQAHLLPSLHGLTFRFLPLLNGNTSVEAGSDKGPPSPPRYPALYAILLCLFGASVSLYSLWKANFDSFWKGICTIGIMGISFCCLAYGGSQILECFG